MISAAALVGATAVGKSVVAVEIAERLGAEIVSADSMQVYRGLDAGTAKPSPELRARVPHHLIDVVDYSHEFTVAEFQTLARAAVADISARGLLPLIVGGSGLYFRAAVDDLRLPPRSQAIRSRLEGEAERLGAVRFHERLRRIDPVAAERIEPNNTRRVVRALEVIEVTGSLFSDNDSWDRYESVYRLAAAGLRRPRAELHQRIAGRVDDMLALGLVAEARSLAERGLSRTARRGIGYAQVLEAPEERSTAEVRAAIVAATRRLIRRQESWFKADPRIAWFEAVAPRLADDLAHHLRARLGPSKSRS